MEPLPRIRSTDPYLAVRIENASELVASSALLEELPIHYPLSGEVHDAAGASCSLGVN